MPRLHLRPAAIGAALLCAFATGPAARAQARFELLTRDAITEISGLQIFTIRDNHLGACYTIFVLTPTAPTTTPPSLEPSNQPSSPEELEKADVLRQVRDAATKRDRQLSELRARTGPLRSDGTKVVEYETARAQIEDEFERALAPLLPGSYTYVTPLPGMRTGGWEDVAEAIRRGLANPDPTTFRTFGDSGGLNTQFESWFRGVIEAPRLAASGPAPCDPSSSNKAGAPR